MVTSYNFCLLLPLPPLPAKKIHTTVTGGHNTQGRYRKSHHYHHHSRHGGHTPESTARNSSRRRKWMLGDTYGQTHTALATWNPRPVWCHHRWTWTSTSCDRHMLETHALCDQVDTPCSYRWNLLLRSLSWMLGLRGCKQNNTVLSSHRKANQWSLWCIRSTYLVYIIV